MKKFIFIFLTLIGIGQYSYGQGDPKLSISVGTSFLKGISSDYTLKTITPGKNFILPYWYIHYKPFVYQSNNWGLFFNSAGGYTSFGYEIERTSDSLIQSKSSGIQIQFGLGYYYDIPFGYNDHRLVITAGYSLNWMYNRYRYYLNKNRLYSKSDFQDFQDLNIPMAISLRALLVLIPGDHVDLAGFINYDYYLKEEDILLPNSNEIWKVVGKYRPTVLSVGLSFRYEGLKYLPVEM